MTRKQEKPRHSLHHSGCLGFLSFLYMLFGFCQCKTSSSACLGSACLLQTRVRGIPPTLGWGKQSTWLAASGSLAHLWAWPTPTPGGATSNHRKAPVVAVSALCAGFGVEVEEVVPVEGIWTALGRVWGGGCPGHSNSEKERLHGPLFGPFGGVRFSY